MLKILTRFVLPLSFSAIGVAWALGGEWDKFLTQREGTFTGYKITNLAFRGSFAFGSMGAAVGIAIENRSTAREAQERAKAKQRLLSRVSALTGSPNIPDDTRAAICLILEDLQNADS